MSASCAGHGVADEITSAKTAATVDHCMLGSVVSAATLEQGLAEFRQIIDDMQPNMLLLFGLGDALEAHLSPTMAKAARPVGQLAAASQQLGRWPRVSAPLSFPPYSSGAG